MTQDIFGPDPVRDYPPIQRGNLADLLDRIAARQPIDDDLTAIAALSTTEFGRSLLEQADALSARTTLDVWSRAEGETPEGAQSKAVAARAEAISTANAYTDAEVEKAIKAGAIKPQGPWDAGTAYDPLDMVSHAGTSWYTLEATVAGEEPGVSAKWFDYAGGIDQATADALYTSKEQTRALVLEPGPLRDVDVFDEGTNPRPLEVFGGYLWGRTSGGVLHRSDDDGQSWTEWATGPGAPIGVLPCADGEVLWVLPTEVYRSSGWAGGSPTFAKVLDIDGGPSSYLLRVNIDGDGTKFIAAEYASPTEEWGDSRYVWISLDQGATWSVVWDTVAEFPADYAESHLHGACYDPWEDRFWFIEGHGDPKGVRYSDDDGDTWTALPAPDYLPAGGEDLDWPPFTCMATDHGIVCGSDSREVGIQVIARTDPADLTLEWQHRIASHRGGGFSWGYSTFRDPATGIVYVGFRADHTTLSPFVLASDGRVSGQVWEYQPGASGDRVHGLVVTPNGVAAGFLTLDNGATTRHVYGQVTGPFGTRPAHTYDTGAVFGGQMSDPRRQAVAVGPASQAGYRGFAAGLEAVAGGDAVAVGRVAIAADFAVAVGHGADATDSIGAVVIGSGAVHELSALRAVIIGYQAKGASRAVAIGGNTSANAFSVVIGEAATITEGGSAEAVAIGANAEARDDCVAIGYAAGYHTGSPNFWVAVGHGAKVDASNAVAIGKDAQALHTGSVALGQGVQTTAAQQVAIGDRGLFMLNRANPATPFGGGMPYVKDGKLFYIGSSGTITELAPA